MVDALQEYLERKRAYHREHGRKRRTKDKAMREQNKRLRAALQEAVDVYGKPGGPWNVPSDPGGWISRARKVLEETK